MVKRRRHGDSCCGDVRGRVGDQGSGCVSERGRGDGCPSVGYGFCPDRFSGFDFQSDAGCVL